MLSCGIELDVKSHGGVHSISVIHYWHLNQFVVVSVCVLEPLVHLVFRLDEIPDPIYLYEAIVNLALELLPFPRKHFRGIVHAQYCSIVLNLVDHAIHCESVVVVYVNPIVGWLHLLLELVEAHATDISMIKVSDHAEELNIVEDELTIHYVYWIVIHLILKDVASTLINHT